MQNEEKQMSILYRFTKTATSIHNRVTRLSNYNFSKLYARTSIVCIVLVGLHCICKSDVYPLVYGMGYLFGLFISTFTVRIYMQNAFRNIVGVIFAALIFPMLLAIVLAKSFSGEVEVMLLYGAYLLAMSAYCIDWSLIIGLFKADCVKGLLKKTAFQWKREVQVNRERKTWNNSGFRRVTPRDWRMLNHEQRIMYIEYVLINEMQQLAIDAQINIHHYSLDRGIHALLEFSVDLDRNRISWDADAVDWYPLECVIQDAIMCLQEYQWLMQIKAIIRHNASCDKELFFLQCQDFCSTSSALAFDLLTGCYAKIRADWYCKYD